MRVATAAYGMEIMTSWAQYEDKIAEWVCEAAEEGAEMLVFPEWSAIELATLAGPDMARDVEASLFAVSERFEHANAIHAQLAAEHRVYILGGSGFVATSQRPVNRAHFFAPSGAVATQDKQIMTRYERDVMRLQPGAPLRLFETCLGRIGVLICYDVEFPLLGRALSECDVLLVPSVTESLHGYWRVRIGAMARALESQCVTVMASLVGEAPWSEAADTSTGMGGVFGPPDKGFPPSGVIAEGAVNQAGWTYADIDLSAIANVRQDGTVLGRQHWSEQYGRDCVAHVVELR
ncbi:MAG: carbon-nitrogen hydrolase family protein [Pseudomonadota bacterium]